MKTTKLLMGIALAALAVAPVRAQYLITLNDMTRITLDEPNLTFVGEGQDDTAIQVGDETVPLAQISSITPADPDVPKPYVIAYHPYYAGSDQLPPADKITHVNYSFAEVCVSDGVYKGFKLQGSFATLRRTLNLKNENPDLKVMLSFTHTVVRADNKQDGGFSAIAASDEYRKQFAQDCVDYMEQYGIDGIDLDWEFPGLSWSGAACDPAHDVDNYTLLVKQMRETFGDRYLLTFAGYCMDVRGSGANRKYIDVKAVEPYVDFVNIMTYDFASAPGYHNAIKHSSSYWDIVRTIADYRKAGFPMEKIVLGIPFYLRHDWSTSMTYPKIKALSESDGYKIDNWNESAQVPYVTLNGKFYGSYDNPRSIERKAKYASEQGLRGLFYWCTYEDDAERTLTNALWKYSMMYLR